MSKNEQDARNRIIKVATEILQEVSDVDKITVRQISERAHVGVGTINYHFDSKDNLMGIVVGNIMADLIDNIRKPKKNTGAKPVQELKTMLKGVCDIGAAKKSIIQFMLKQAVLSGDMQTPLYLIPFLKEIFGDEKEEIQLRIIALQILQPIQIAGISPTAFLMYSGVDFNNQEERNQFIDMLVDNILGSKGEHLK